MMKNEDFTCTFRPATDADAGFVAWAVLTAVGIEDPKPEFLASATEICRRADVLYSWKNTLMAEVAGNPVGSITAYDGAGYKAMREVTFPLFMAHGSPDFRDMEMETATGEFYLDSMAVLSEYRRKGIATALLKAGIARARALNIPKVAMVVSPEKPEAQRLYESLGFHYERDMFLFGEDYRKMVKVLD